MSDVKKLKLADLTLDPRLQMRVQMDGDTIEEYAEHIDELPPGKVVMDEDGHLYLTAGWHRFEAHKKKGKDVMSCSVREGTFLDALQEAAGENFDHGLRRTNADKHRAVDILLAENSENNHGWSGSDVARMARVTSQMVNKVISGQNGHHSSKSETVSNSNQSGSTTQTNTNGATQGSAMVRGRFYVDVASGSERLNGAQCAVNCGQRTELGDERSARLSRIRIHSRTITERTSRRNAVMRGLIRGFKRRLMRLRISLPSSDIRVLRTACTSGRSITRSSTTRTSLMPTDSSWITLTN